MKRLARHLCSRLRRSCARRPRPGRPHGRRRRRPPARPPDHGAAFFTLMNDVGLSEVRLTVKWDATQPTTIMNQSGDRERPARRNPARCPGRLLGHARCRLGRSPVLPGPPTSSSPSSSSSPGPFRPSRTSSSATSRTSRASGSPSSTPTGNGRLRRRLRGAAGARLRRAEGASIRRSTSSASGSPRAAATTRAPPATSPPRR